MHTGTHIPAYLLLERFAKGKDVLDIHAPNAHGLEALLPIANSVTVVQPNCDALSAFEQPAVNKVVAAQTELPFRAGSFDMVLLLHMDFQSQAFSLEQHLKSARSLLTPSGIVAVLVPNMENMDNHVDTSAIPDFLDLERLLRHYFPHLMMFAQQPLFGATLSPIGRRLREDAPLLDDRMLPEEGEAPDCFVALCSPKYHRLDDTVIAQLPFRPMSEGIKLQVEKYEGTIRLIQAEKKARDRKLEQFSMQLDELNDKLAEADLEVRDKSSLIAKITYLNEQMVRKETAIVEAEKKSEEKSQRKLELEDAVLNYQRTIRRLEQQISDLERVNAISLTERDEYDVERNQLLSQLHDAQMDNKAKQRQLDEQIEEVASREAELEALRTETASLRNQLQVLRDEKRLLTIQTGELANHGAIIESLEQELGKARALALQDKQRLNQQFELEHKKLLEEISTKEEIRRKAYLVELQVKELELTVLTDSSRSEAQAEEILGLISRVQLLQSEKRELLSNKREADRALEELRQSLQSQNDALERSEHSMTLLGTRTDDAEQRSKAMQQRVSLLQTKLVEAEQHCKELQLQEGRLHQLEEKYKEAQEKASELEQALALAAGRSQEVAHKSEHLADLEARYKDAMQQVRELKRAAQEQDASYIELEVKSLRLEQLEQRAQFAFAQIDKLQREVEDLRPMANTAVAIRKRAEANELKYTEEQLAHQQTKAALLDVQAALSKAESDITEEQFYHQQTQAKMQETESKIERLEADLTTAMDALVQSEEGAENQMNSAGEKIKHLRNEFLRLRHENETELLCVREDLETELRHSLRRLEQAQQEIWELREDVVRLKAQSAATAAASAHKGINEGFQKTLIEQESVIESIGTERERLRDENEDLNKSLLNRKKNMRILAMLLKREHHEHLLSATANSEFHTQPLKNADIRRLIEEEGGNLTDELDFLDEPEIAGSDDEVVDAIMESVIVNGIPTDKGREPSTHFHLDNLFDKDPLSDDEEPQQ